MPTRRQTIVSGAGGGAALLTGTWFLTRSEDPESENGAETHMDRSDSTAEPESETADNTGDADGSKDSTNSDSDSPPQKDPGFTVTAVVERTDRVRLDDEITVHVTVENTTDSAGKAKYHVKCYRIDPPHGRDDVAGDVSLPSGESKTVSHTFGFEDTGKHVVELKKKEIDRFYVYPSRPRKDPDPTVETGGDGGFSAGEEESVKSDS